MAADETLLSVFVYGTLKRGERNHDRFCSGAAEIRAATTPGSLYDLPFGFPGLRVHKENVHAFGTTDYASDVRKQHRERVPLDTTPVRRAVVHGEVVTFDEHPERLAALDALEGYAPGEEGLYERVLIPVESEGERFLAWAYEIKRAFGVYLPGGRWPV